MTFLDKELSADEGQPIELYTFTIGNDIYRYTNTSEAISNAQGIYIPVPIDRSSIEQKPDAGRLPIDLTSIDTLPAIQRWIESPSMATMSLTIQAMHITDSPAPELFVVWQGRVLNVDFTHNTCNIRCEPIFTSLKRPGLRRKYQIMCPHVLYGSSCKLDKTQQFVTADIVTSDGLTFTYDNDTNDAKGDPLLSGQAVGGYIEWAVSGVTERRAVKTHTGKTIRLNLASSTLVPGTPIDIYRGCTHSPGYCNTVFDNLNNYGGFPYSSVGRNPFATHSPLF